MKTEKDLQPLLDGDVIRYRSLFAIDRQIIRDFKEEYPGATDEEVQDFVANHDYLHAALGNVKGMIETTYERFRDGGKLFIQSPDKTFRYEVATLEPYKGKRVNNPKPKYFDEATEYMKEVWDAIEVRRIETDDEVAIRQYENTEKYSVICTVDKDLIQGVPGWHWNWMTNELTYNSLKEANLFHFYQMLVGDAVDSIPGIKGIGPKKAGAILNECNRDIDCVRRKVQELYRKQYGEMWEPAYEEVSKLLYILRKPEHLTTGCPFLWH